MEANIATNTHILSISHITEEDYGNYSCLATNKVGRDRLEKELADCFCPHYFGFIR